MSHYTVTVVLPPQVDPVSDAGRGLLERALSHYDENREDCTHPRWDWYQVGGRWSEYFAFHPGAVRRVVSPTSLGRRCDGGRIEDLDLERMRAEAARSAAETWDEYWSLVEGTPSARPWSEFYARVEREQAEVLGGMVRYDYGKMLDAELRVKHGFPYEEDQYYAEWSDEEDEESEVPALVGGGDGVSARRARYTEASNQIWKGIDRQLLMSGAYSIEQARADFHSQPRVQVYSKVDRWLWESPLVEVEPYSREEYVARKRRRAVPSYATLLVLSDDADAELYRTEWIEKGRMGWFGMGSDNEDSEDVYLERIEELIAGLDPRSSLVLVDCHI